MSSIFASEAGRQLFAEACTLLQNNEFYSERDRPFVFLCGGPIHDTADSLRKEFLAYVSNQLEKFSFILAEKATQDITAYDEPQPIDLAEFENLLADIADCVLIFPEAVGSYVELGFFSRDKTLDKILLVNDVAHQNYSFINDGPRRWIDERSIFNGSILIDYKPDSDRTDSYKTVCNRLFERLGGKKNKKKLTLQNFNHLTGKEQLLLILIMVDVLCLCDFNDIKAGLRRICGGGMQSSEKRIKHLLSILVSAKLIVRLGDKEDLFIADCDSTAFVKIDNPPFDTKAKILAYMQSDLPEVYQEFLDTSNAA